MARPITCCLCGCPEDSSARPEAHHTYCKQGEDLLWEPRPLPTEPCRLPARQEQGPARPHARGRPDVTYASRASQLLAALARGIQIDVFTLTSLLTGVFTLGETG